MEYIPIISPLSLNKYDKKTSDVPSGNLVELENYIPSNKILKTREGISSFDFYVPPTEATLSVHHEFNNISDKFQDEVQGADWWDGVGDGDFPAFGSTFALDEYSWYSTTSGTRDGVYFKENSLLPSGFPGKNNEDFIATCWLHHTTSSVASIGEIMMTKGWPGSASGSWNLRLDTLNGSACLSVSVRHNDNSGTTKWFQPLPGNHLIGAFNFYAFWHSSVLKRCGLMAAKRTGSIGYTAYDYEDGVNQDDTYLTLGGYTNNGATFDTQWLLYGFLDEVKVFTDMPIEETLIYDTIYNTFLLHKT